MDISNELKKQISIGDYTLIAEIYQDKHTRGRYADFKTVTSRYVQMVIDGERPATPGTAAEEIMEIAAKYLAHKRDFRETILI